ncbi:MAG: tRNA (N6-isopentenyl adenosine(37)-C2)-methylthiotransferase MiaB [Elusimicrobia bacterium]|nr:tRNA (N6-isopentenyl adenosine(37)-C2)-methylthiotransferase MiaB [Elusimicrobiota bacterium]
MNVADSEEMLRAFEARGFQSAQDIEGADAVLINTCTIRQHAEDRALSLVGSLKKWKTGRPERLLIVAGCAAERTQVWLQKRFPHVDLVTGAKSIEQFPQILEQALQARFNWHQENIGLWPQAEPAPTPTPAVQNPSSVECRTDPGSPASSYVTIMRGCNYTCTYCIVPAVRGREIYRPVAGILDEIRRKAADGVREVTLLGQTVNSYRYLGTNFADLLRLVNDVEALESIRFTSSHPYYLTDALIEAMFECRKVCPRLHLPVQSGSDRILKKMRRNYTRRFYLERLAALRRKIPRIAITTDIIVGFPSETEEDFRQTLSLVGEADFRAAYCFKFSPRQGTEAAVFETPVPRPIQEERLSQLLDVVKSQARRKC